MPRKSKKTMRKMSPLAREIAKTAGELHGLSRRLLTLSEKVDSVEFNLASFERWKARFQNPESKAAGDCGDTDIKF